MSARPLPTRIAEALHRDLKPGNVMLGKYGETLVVDWGLAKATDAQTARAGASATVRAGQERDDANAQFPAETPLKPRSQDSDSATRMGEVMGTPAYMSPEQAQGRLDLLGPASDVYSLGAMLFMLLTGMPPVEGADAAEVLRKVHKGEIRAPRQLKPQTSRALDAICRKAMSIRPADRYASALALAADIEHWLADEPVTAYRER